MTARYIFFGICFLLINSFNLLLSGCNAKIVRPIAVSNQEYEQVEPQGQITANTLAEIRQRYPDGFWKENGLKIPHVALSQRKNVVVKTFSTHEDQEELAHSITDVFVSTLVQSNSFIVVERQNIDYIFSEFKLNQSGIMDQQDAAEPGELKNVALIITGSIGQRIEVRAVDVRTGEIMVSEQTTSPAVTISTAQELAKNFISHLVDAVYTNEDMQP
ncbi:MAG: hypothetical protein D3903_08740 [Candidatus Electrothrix sp. GM3_4]|nr:hypothetical protein [Candidatus Electrothrix sp. GM3_4]